MKKILIFICSCVLIILITACDNNNGPYDIERENGNLVLYSNNKPAKGWIEKTVIDHNTGITTRASLIKYDKGLPTGEFKYYDSNGTMIWEANLKKDGDLFKGTITFSGFSTVYSDNVKGEMKGTFVINPNWIVEKHADLNPSKFFNETAVDAVYDGNDQKGRYKSKKKDGEWTFYNNNEELIRKSSYKNGELDGVYESYYENGQLDQRNNYENGKLEAYEFYYKSGQLAERGNYKDGESEIYYENGNLKSKFSSEGYERYYENGYLEKKESYKNGEMEEYYENGQLKIKSNLESFERYYENGQLATKMLSKDGQLDGISEIYYENGKLSVKQAYKAGKLNGISEIYAENGQLEKKENYKNGELEGMSEYYKDGKIVEKSDYKYDANLGYSVKIYKELYKNGKLMEKINYKNGRLDGLYEVYKENGQLDERRIYKNGQLENTEVMIYSEDGKLMKELNF